MGAFEKLHYNIYMAGGGPIFRRPSISVYKGSPKKNFLLIPDAHLPDEVEGCIDFLKDVQKLYNIPEENVICLGDLWENYNLSRFLKSPDYRLTAEQEIDAAIEKTQEWIDAFPLLQITVGNHDTRGRQRAEEASLPKKWIRDLREVYKLPKTWELHECVVPKVKHPFVCFHGNGFGISSRSLVGNPGKMGGISLAFGHWHSLASIMHVNTLTGDHWSFNVGCLVREEADCFKYGAKAPYKPSIGCGVVLDEGRQPIWVPMPRK